MMPAVNRLDLFNALTQWRPPCCDLRATPHDWFTANSGCCCTCDACRLVFPQAL